MRIFCIRNVVTVSLLSSILAFGGIAHSQEREKPQPGVKKEQARKGERESTRNRVTPPAKPRSPAGELTTYLGVAIQPIDEAVRAQLDLPAGTGIAVGGLMPDSPAEKAGVKKFDVLTKLDDQILITGEQFQTLVRMKKPGDEITLTLLRATKEKTIKVKLDSHRFPMASAGPQRDFPAGPRGQIHGAPPRWNNHDWQDHWKQFGDEWGKGVEKWLEKHGAEWEGDLRKFLDESFGDPETWEPKMKKWLESEIRPQFETHVRKFAHAQTTIVDDSGKVVVTMKEGKKHVTATDPGGKLVFEGFCETDAERKKVPKDILKKVDSVKVDIQFDSPGNLKKSPPKPKKPTPKKSSGKKDGAV